MIFNKTEWKDDTCRASEDGSQVRITTAEADAIYRHIGKCFSKKKDIPPDIASFMEDMWDEFYDAGR